MSIEDTINPNGSFVNDTKCKLQEETKSTAQFVKISIALCLRLIAPQGIIFVSAGGASASLLVVCSYGSANPSMCRPISQCA
ncbi:unnamed protein product [Ceratitis capitata]|uniref:(Mediterranean fruit fly) hypothetical protein n=1 Tax=Ceratitis capitata TaxID=7213 RepID=A0A811U868_CERCA|nr:unnamed protein product [Ceratitis capitata]